MELCSYYQTADFPLKMSNEIKNRIHEFSADNLREIRDKISVGFEVRTMLDHSEGVTTDVPRLTENGHVIQGRSQL